MQELDVNETILIVVGADIKPEEKDRPLAYWLQRKIQEAAGYGKTPFRKSVVISDALYKSDKIIQACPTICIGGPGVNSLANEWVKSLPVYISEDDRYFIQYDLDSAKKRISIWGMDQETTSGALNVFVESGLLKQYLERIWN
jgi:hypothetical protein